MRCYHWFWRNFWRCLIPNNNFQTAIDRMHILTVTVGILPPPPPPPNGFDGGAVLDGFGGLEGSIIGFDIRYNRN